MSKRGLIKALKQRIKALESAKQNYGWNAAFMKNVKIANIEAIQNELSVLREILTAVTR